MSEERLGIGDSTPGLKDGMGLTLEQGRAEMERRRVAQEKAALKMDILAPTVALLATALGMQALGIGPKIPPEKSEAPAASTLLKEETVIRTPGEYNLTLEQYDKLNDVLDTANGLFEPVLHWFHPEQNPTQDI